MKVLGLLDYKSGFVSWEAELQLGGYNLLVRAGDNGRGHLCHFRPTIAALLSTTAKHTKPAIVLNQLELQRASRAFLYALALYRYAEARGRAPKATGRYTHPTTGEPYVSVTEVLGFAIEKPNLRRWYLTCGQKGVDPQAYMEARGKVGTAIHHALATYVVTHDLPLATPTTEHDHALTHFAAWDAVADLEPTHCHGVLYADGVKLYHPRLRFAGQPDCLGTLNPDALVIHQGAQCSPTGI